jgi:hypothetical protein
MRPDVDRLAEDRVAARQPRDVAAFGQAEQQMRGPRVAQGDSHQIKLACPKCGASAMVALKNLDRYFRCRRCAMWFRIAGKSLIEVAAPPDVVDLHVRMGFSDWQDDRYRDEPARDVWLEWRKWLVRSRYRIAAACGVLFVAVIITVARFKVAAPNLQVDFPPALESRVPLWIGAWFSADVGRLTQLTAKSYDRQMRQWVARNPPPGDCDRDSLLESEIKLTSIKMRGKQTADVTAEVRAVDRDGRPKRINVTQTWILANGAWYYAPAVPRRSTRQSFR